MLEVELFESTFAGMVARSVLKEPSHLMFKTILT